jgi:RNA polymerase sigma-70 factor (ECF subfamily)
MAWSDLNLARQLKADIRPAFEATVRQQYQSVYRQLWHLCGDRDLAADLTQETFEQAWRSRESFQGRSSARTWLYTIALRVWHKSRAAGKASRGGDTEFGEWTDALPDHEPGPAQRLELRERRRSVACALACLPDEYRETLILYYVQGLKYREVAEVLGVPMGTVKSRLHSGLKRLQDALGADDEVEKS